MQDVERAPVPAAQLPTTPQMQPTPDNLWSFSDQDLAHAYCTGPVIYEYGNGRVVRLSDHLVIKGGPRVSRGEAETQMLAATMGLRVPAVHRVFRHVLTMSYGKKMECWLIVMDFVRGQVLDKLWPTLDDDGRKSMAKRVAELIQRLQSTPVQSIGVGPVGGSDGEPWFGPFFTDYGNGPFPTLSDLEDWYNHKLDVSIGFCRVPASAPRFRFEKTVLSHLDIAPRNIIIEEGTGDMVLIDWALGGIFPTGFEQAALAQQYVGEWDIEFSDAVVDLLPEGHDYVAKQLDNIGYGLTTGALL